MLTPVFVILVLSILFQLSAAIYALSLIRFTGMKYSWIMISIALILMCTRRIIPLYNIYCDSKYPVDLSIEIIGLTLSVLIFSGFRGIGSIIIEHRQSEEKIKSLLKEKEIILKEVHHRIKNNMSTVKSLLALQGGNMKDEKTVAAFKDAESRVNSMIVLYNKLYRSTDFNEISVKDYIPSLVLEIISGFPSSSKIKLETEIDNFRLSSNTLFTLGIIINELLTNIMKYAFTGRPDGLISVSASLRDNQVIFIIQDNGNGIPESIDFEHSNGFGLMLVWMLTQQISGSIKIERGNGTKIILEFPYSKI